jgi:DNA-binding response OmpR family regulator
METASSSSAKSSVLIVDDSTTNLRLITAMLLEEGIDPRPLSDSLLALPVAKANPPDLILLDIDMPGLNGFELCKQFKDDAGTKEIPIIFISGLDGSGNVVKGLALGGVDYVTKPFQAEEVMARIRAHLRIVNLQRQLSRQNQELERQVSERTRDLANANRRLGEMTKLKSDFLFMISHELRTPANGLFGFTDLVFELCPPSAEVDQYRVHYQRSKQRLLRLITDAGLISDLTESLPGPGNLLRLPSVLDGVRNSLPHIVLELDGADSLDGVLVQDEHGLILRALETTVSLADAFSSTRGKVRFKARISPKFVTLQVALDALRLSSQSVTGFFEIESLARSSSAAEPLGLAPVVAQRILSALGGDLRLSKQEGDTGNLEAIIATGERNGA